jgi:archaellum biogenesis ATPase FlaH
LALSERYEWGESFQRKILALYIREPQTCHTFIEPIFFTDPILADIAKVVKTYYDSPAHRNAHFELTSLWATVRSHLGEDKREQWNNYKETLQHVFKIKLADRPMVLSTALEFARERKYTETLIQCEKDISAHKYQLAHQHFDALKNFGKELDVGLRYWEDINAERWSEDHRGQIPTIYFKALDDAMGGGPGGGELVIVLAPGKKGKSALLGQVAAGALFGGKRIALATAELSAEKYRKRIDSLLLGLQAKELERAEGTELKNVLIRMRAMRRQLVHSNLYLKYFTTGKATTGDIESWLENIAQRDGPVELLIVDYLFLFRPEEHEEERRHKIGQLAVELRGIANERNIPVWTASQGNRASLSKTQLRAEDFAEDISQFWTLDFLIAICQNKEEEKRRPQQARLFLAAARDVAGGFEQTVRLDRATYTMKPIKGKGGVRWRATSSAAVIVEKKKPS